MAKKKKAPRKARRPSPATAEEARARYSERRDAAVAHIRDVSRGGRDIGEIPAPANPDRLAACKTDFRLFCESYLRPSFSLAWSADHLRVIAKIERAVLKGGLFAVAMPRGSGKTTLCQAAVLWALLYGHRRFVALIGAEATSAAENLHAIRSELENNSEIGLDFTEVCYPIKRMEGVGQRRLLYKDKLVRIEMSSTDIVLPDIPGTVAGQGVVRVSGITGRIRGMSFKRSDGKNVRPDLVVLDDPQTDESARNPAQCDSRERVISGTILGLAGPGRKIAALMPCTIIQPDDLAARLLSQEKSPEWQGELTRMVESFPTNEIMWRRYNEIREASLRDGRGIDDATAFYVQNRELMDEGGKVNWEARYNPDEASALQHAMNLKYRDEVAFWFEYQNDPSKLSHGLVGDLTADDIAKKINRIERGGLPIGAQHVTAFIDVQERLLYWMVCAFSQDFTGWIVDYGSFPDQGRPYFSYADARQTLSRAFSFDGVEQLIHAGLEHLVNSIAERSFVRRDGAVLRAERIIVDANWQTETVYGYVQSTKHPSIVTPSHGKYVGARSPPWSDYKRKPGDRVGPGWRLPNVQGRRAVRYCLSDTNYWKSFLHARLAVGLGGVGSLTLFGDDPRVHRMVGEHLAAEFRTRTTGRGRDVDEWQLKPGRPDNHLLDCAVGCCVGASMQGASLPGAMVKQDRAERKKVGIPEHMRR